MRVLVVDDEKEIVDLITVYLKNIGYEFEKAYNGEDAINLLDNNTFDMALLDIMMPGKTGLEVLNHIQQTSGIPVIILSAKNDDMDKISALSLGADDYIPKPFNPLEVVARVQAVLRRTMKSSPKNTSIKVQDICIDTESCTVTQAANEITFTSKEYQLLLLMMSHPKKVFTKQQLYENVWEEDYMFDDHTIMVYISKLRDKLNDNPKSPRYIKNIRGLGYYFEKDLPNE